MTILGPLPWSTTSAVIRAAPSAAASVVSDPPSSTRRTAGSVTDSPGAAETRLTSSVSPIATLCWWPPVRTIAYTERLLETVRGKQRGGNSAGMALKWQGIYPSRLPDRGRYGSTDRTLTCYSDKWLPLAMYFRG